MTRKDYVLIAAALSAVFKDSDSAGQTAIRRAAYVMAFRMQTDNTRFDIGRFVAAATGA